MYTKVQVRHVVPIPLCTSVRAWHRLMALKEMGGDTPARQGSHSIGKIGQTQLLAPRVEQESRTPVKFVVIRQVWGQARKSIHVSGSGLAIARQVQREAEKSVQGPGSAGSTASSYSTAHAVAELKCGSWAMGRIWGQGEVGQGQSVPQMPLQFRLFYCIGLILRLGLVFALHNMCLPAAVDV